MTVLAVVLAFMVAALLGLSAGMDCMLWWMHREHPAAYYALRLSVARKKERKREGEQ